MGTKQKHNNTPSSEASVIDNYLVLSFPHAVEPVIWRMALDEIGTATLEVKKEARSENYALILKKTKTSQVKIAILETRDEAVEALQTASNALLNKQTPSPLARKEKPVVSAIAQENSKEILDNIRKERTKPSKKWVYLGIAALFVILLYSYLGSLIPEQANGFNAETSTTASPLSTPAQKTGVALDADDFFSGQ